MNGKQELAMQKSNASRAEEEDAERLGKRDKLDV